MLLLSHLNKLEYSKHSIVKLKLDLQEVGGGWDDWMELAQDRDR